MLKDGIDGGGTCIAAEAPADGWPEHVTQWLTDRPRGPIEIEGVEVYARAVDGGLELHAPRRARLLIRRPKARLYLAALALEHIGPEAWLAKWVPWATAVLGGSQLGWEPAVIDTHVDIIGLELPASWIVLGCAWSGRSARSRPIVDGYTDTGELIGVRLGAKCDHARGRKTSTSLHAYWKLLQLDEQSDPHEPLLAIYRAAGWRGEPVLRIEVTAQGDALDLQGPGGRWNLRSLEALHDPEALRGLMAYVIGRADKLASGCYRLTSDAPEHRDTPAKKRPLHPMWATLRLLVTKGAPIIERQVRATRDLERASRAERAKARAGRTLGQLAGIEGRARDPAQAARYAAQIIPEITAREDWPTHVQSGRIDHADLHDLEAPSPRGEPEK